MKKPKPKFKIGDIVFIVEEKGKIIDYYYNYLYERNEEIISIWYTIEYFNKKENRHNGLKKGINGIIGKEGYCYNEKECFIKPCPCVLKTFLKEKNVKKV